MLAPTESTSASAFASTSFRFSVSVSAFDPFGSCPFASGIEVRKINVKTTTDEIPRLNMTYSVKYTVTSIMQRSPYYRRLKRRVLAIFLPVAQVFRLPASQYRTAVMVTRNTVSKKCDDTSLFKRTD